MMENSLFQNIADLMLERIDHSLYVIKDMGIDVDLICDRHLHRKFDEINMQLSEREVAEIYLKLANINEVSADLLSENESNYLMYVADKRMFELATGKELKDNLEDWAEGWRGYAISSKGTAEEGKEVSCMYCCECCEYFMVGEECYRINELGEYLCSDCHGKRFPTDREWFEYMLCDYIVGKEFSYENGAEKVTITVTVNCTEDYLKSCSDEVIEMLVDDWLMEDDKIDVIAYYTEAE